MGGHSGSSGGEEVEEDDLFAIVKASGDSSRCGPRTLSRTVGFGWESVVK